MVIQVNQELCTGCGMCIDSCSVEAIRLVDQHAVITETLCTQCEACIGACMDGAITAFFKPVCSVSIKTPPPVESLMATVPNQNALPQTAILTHSPAPLAGGVLAFLGNEIAPRLVDVLLTTLESKIVQPKAAAITSATISSNCLPRRGSGKRRQVRYRGGHADTKNQQERR